MPCMGERKCRDYAFKHRNEFSAYDIKMKTNLGIYFRFRLVRNSITSDFANYLALCKYVMCSVVRLLASHPPKTKWIPKKIVIWHFILYACNMCSNDRENGEHHWAPTLSAHPAQWAHSERHHSNLRLNSANIKKHIHCRYVCYPGADL